MKFNVFILTYTELQFTVSDHDVDCLAMEDVTSAIHAEKILKMTLLFNKIRFAFCILLLLPSASAIINET